MSISWNGLSFEFCSGYENCSWNSYFSLSVVELIVSSDEFGVKTWRGEILSLTKKSMALKYCTISTYSSAIVTCDRHEEMRFSLVSQVSCDTFEISLAKLSGLWQFATATAPQAPGIFVHLFGCQGDLWQINQLFFSKGHVTCDQRVASAKPGSAVIYGWLWPTMQPYIVSHSEP